MNRRVAVGVVLGTGLAGLVAGCGASQLAQVVDPVAKAARITERYPGFRMAMKMSVSVPPAGLVTVNASGVFERATHSGKMTMTEGVAGRHLTIVMVYASHTLYMNAGSIPSASLISHGKPWLRLDLSRVLSSMGLGGLPLNNNDPRQFLDYLRAAGDSATRVGQATVRGVSTTRYRVTIDLSRYPKLVPPSQRPELRNTLKRLELALGGHKLPADVWLDSAKRIRRMQLHLPECVSGHRILLNMTMDMFDYGPQPPTPIPAADQVYDITPLVAAQAHPVSPSC